MRAITLMVEGASAFDEGQCGGRRTEYETRAITARACEYESAPGSQLSVKRTHTEKNIG